MSTLDSHVYFSACVWADFVSLSCMPDSFSALILCRSRLLRVYNVNETLVLLNTGEELSVYCLYIIPPRQIVLIPLF